MDLPSEVLTARTPAADLLAKLLARREQSLNGFLLIANHGGQMEALIGSLSMGELAVAVAVAQEDLRRRLFSQPAPLIQPAFPRAS